MFIGFIEYLLKDKAIKPPIPVVSAKKKEWTETWSSLPISRHTMYTQAPVTAPIMAKITPKR